MTANPMDELMDLAHAAAWMKTDAETLRRMTEAGDVPARKFGEVWVFSRAAILDWFEVRPAPASHPTLRWSIDPEGARRRMREAIQQYDETEEEMEAYLAEIYARRRESIEEPE